MSRTYDFEEQNRHSLREISIRSLGNVPFKADLEHAIDSISNLIDSSDSGLMKKRGYIVLVDGPYGVGKTTATWAVTNGIITRHPTAKVFEKSLIPFGNTTEIISSFLTDVALKLWQDRIVDIRKEINQFIFEVSPAAENTKIEATIGPIKIGKDVYSSKHIGDLQDRLENKFSNISKTDCIFLILDDIDRLKPSEIVEMMRLVEKLRSLPRVLVMLPAYRPVISNAFSKVNEVSAVQSKTFTRKLVDYEITLKPDLVTLKRLFTKSFINVGGHIGNLSIAEYAWYCTLHNLIITEALTSIEAAALGADVAKEFNRITSNPEVSEYMLRIRSTLSQISNRSSYILNPDLDPMPTYRKDNNNELFVPFSHDYSHFFDGTDSNSAVRLLSDMRRTNNVMKRITTDSQIVESLKTSPQVEFNRDAEARSSEPAITRFFIPLLSKSADEPFITDNYRARDFLNISRRITGDVRFNSHRSDPEAIYQIVKDVIEMYY